MKEKSATSARRAEGSSESATFIYSRTTENSHFCIRLTDKALLFALVCMIVAALLIGPDRISSLLHFFLPRG